MKSKLLLVIFLGFGFFVARLAFAANTVFYYNPEIVMLKGVVKVRTFLRNPSSQNYNDGYEIESFSYLKLDQPVDVVASAKDKITNNKSEKNITIVQIAILNDEIWSKIKEGNHVCVTGYLFYRLKGHRHYTNILIGANDIQVMGSDSY